jgi:hypothetical protein
MGAIQERSVHLYSKASLRAEQLTVQRAAIAGRIQNVAAANTMTEEDLCKAAEARAEPQQAKPQSDDDNDGDEIEDESDILGNLCGMTGKVKESAVPKPKASAKGKAGARQPASLPPSLTTAARMLRPSATGVSSAPSDSSTTRIATSAAALPPSTPTKLGRKARGGDGFDPQSYLDNDGMEDLRNAMAVIRTKFEQEPARRAHLASSEVGCNYFLFGQLPRCRRGCCLRSASVRLAPIE